MSALVAMSACYVAAIAYARMGLHIFPCGPDKLPLVKWGAGATTDLEQIRQWWTRWPNAMIGMACGPSGIVAIDIDVKDGRNGWAAIRGRLLEWGPLLVTRTTGTPTGGSHLLYRHPGPEYVIRNSAGTKIGDGVDIRGDGGFVIMPPSHGKDGAYEWQVDARTVALPESWAKELCVPKPRPVSTLRPVIRDPRRVRGYGAKVLSEEADKVAAAQPGARNNTITTCAFRVGRVADQCGITSGQAEEMFAWAANQWGDATEARKAADSFWRAFEAGRGEPRQLELRDHG